MKYIKFFISLALSIGILYFLNTKVGQLPPLGKFLNPFHGFWKNAQSETDNPEKLTSIDGLSSPVTIHYDDQLIPHVFAANDTDLYKAQGYITAQHRLWQMEFQTFASAGRLSEILGGIALNFDRGQRRKGMVFGAENSLTFIEKDPQQKALMEAYTEGVNAYINELTYAELPLEYKLLDYQPEPWSLHKTSLLLMYMTDMLAGGDADLQNTNALKLFGKEQFDLLFPDFPADQDPVIPQERDWSDIDPVKIEKPSTDFPSEFISETLARPNPHNGSNNWAIGKEKSATGNPILANDPHLGLNLPSIWYAMQLSTPEKNTFGVTLPGALGIVIGFNDSIAWGMTNATRDVKDWYKIQFKDQQRNEYLYDGEWLPAKKTVEEIKVRGEKTYYDTVIYTHHGPVTYDHSFLSQNGQQNYAMRWIGHEGGNQQKTLLELNKAKNYHDYVEALKHFTAPAQNFIFASATGDIALWIQGKFPNKWPEQGKFLMDGSTSQHEWKGFIPQAHNAYIKNPERGFVSSANQHPTDSTYPYYVYDDGYEHYRNRVINDFFRTHDTISVTDFKALHNNNFNLKAFEIVPHMLENLNDESLNEREKEIYQLMKTWDFNNDIDQKAPAVFEKWWINLVRITWDEMVNDSIDLDYPSSYQTIYLLKNKPNHTLMDIQETSIKEDAPMLFEKSFKKTVEDMQIWETKNGSYEWGNYKATFVRHLLRLPAFSRYNLPIGGNSGIVNATSRNHGPSWRMIVELGGKPKAWAIYPGGQSGNPGSRFYDNMIDGWARGEYFEVLYMTSPNAPTDRILFTQTLTSQNP